MAKFDYNKVKPQPKVWQNRNCLHFATLDGLPYRPRQEACGKPAVGESKSQGFLCEEHQREEDHIRQLRTRKKDYSDKIDNEIIAGIIAAEAVAIGYGKQTRVRFGAIEPIYLRYWHKE